MMGMHTIAQAPVKAALSKRRMAAGPLVPLVQQKHRSGIPGGKRHAPISTQHCVKLKVDCQDLSASAAAHQAYVPPATPAAAHQAYVPPATPAAAQLPPSCLRSAAALAIAQKLPASR